MCCHFMRNLAYFRAAWHDEQLVYAPTEFNKTVSGNFIDICVLEWCKLFGEHKEPHHWKNIVKNKSEFKSGLFTCLETDCNGFNVYWNIVRTYRDEFVAHLDSVETMQIPKMDWAYQSVLYYFEEIIEEYQTDSIYQGIPTDLELYYQSKLNEAKAIYERET